jgi:hypothetical protein
MQRRIAAAAALPVRFPGTDGVLFDPTWQDDICSNLPTPETKQE